MKIFLQSFFYFLIIGIGLKTIYADDLLAVKEKKCSELHPRIKAENQFWYEDELFLENRKACYELGLAYYHGHDTMVDKNKAASFFVKAMEYEDYDAQYMYGLMMLEGEGSIAKDSTKALNMIQAAGEKGSVSAQYKLAQLFGEGSLVSLNDETAFYWYSKAAQNGHVKAQYEAANRYELGIGVKQDLTAAVKWFGDAAEKGLPEAQYRLGMMFFTGEPLPQDYSAAFNLIQKSAEQKFNLAEYFMGYMYEEGYGVEQNRDLAIKWYEKSAQNGFNRAYLRLAEMGIINYQIMLAKAYLLGENGFQKEPEKSAFWLETAAKMGNVDAQFKIGFYYLEGFGVEQSEEKALAWFKSAALAGHQLAKKTADEIQLKQETNAFLSENKELFAMAERGGDLAQYQLGANYEKKYSAKAVENLEDYDLKEALKWYQLSADKNNPDALYRLGKAYLLGELMAPDQEKGLTYLKKAGEKNNYDAQKMLARLFEQDLLGKPDLKEALYWHQKAVALNKPEAFYWLGHFYYQNLTKNDYEEQLYNAWFWLEKARQHGIENAVELIEKINNHEIKNSRLKKNEIIKTFIEKLIQQAKPDNYVAEKLGLRRYSREETKLSDLLYAYAVNAKCGYEQSVTVGAGIAMFKNEVDDLIKKIGEEKASKIKAEARELAEKVTCDTREAYKARSILFKFTNQ